MKKLLFFLLVPFLTYGQHNRDTYYCKYVGKPTVIAPTIGAYSIDCDNNVVWRSTSKTTVAWTIETNAKIVAKLIAQKGDKGDKGDPGNDGVCPPCPPGGGTNTGFPFVVISTTGTDDYTILNNAWETCRVEKKQLYILGEIKVSNGIRTKRDHKRPSIIAGIITTLNNNAYAVIGSDFPTSTADAEFYVERIYEIRNLTINCGTNQIGIAPGPNKGSIFEGNLINGGAAGLYNRFALNGTANRNEFLGQAYPTVTAHGGTLPLPGILANYGSWPDGTVSNSCSNVFTFNHNRVYSSGATVWANSCFASDGVFYYDGINEGLKILFDYRIDALGSTTAKRWGVIRSHHETVITSTDVVNEAMVYCRAPSGQLQVENPLGHYGTIMINAGGTVGTLNVTMLYNAWWVPVQGKFWYNSSAGGNTAWQIKLMENLGSDPAILPGLFAGTPVKYWNGEGINPGNNTVTFEPIPR